jgi:DNA-binding MarR family transcriptional regulator
MKKKEKSQTRQPGWTFLTNHCHVLICIARDPEVLLRDVADSVGITERAVQKIIQDLEDAGYLEKTREGRRNRYSLIGSMPLRHPVESHKKIRELLALME